MNRVGKYFLLLLLYPFLLAAIPNTVNDREYQKFQECGATGIPCVTIQGSATGTAIPISGTVTSTPSGTQSVNTAQVNGVTASVGNGVSGTGVQRVTIASDSTGQVALATGAATIGALTANQSVNVAQINGVTTSMGVGASGTGTLRVVTATNDPCQSSGIAKSSVVLNVTASAQVIAASGSTIIYVCGFTATVGGTVPTYQFQYGTGSVCATGVTNLSGVFAPTVGSFNTYTPGMTAFATTASQALCIATGGTSPSVQGILSYVQI